MGRKSTLEHFADVAQNIKKASWTLSRNKQGWWTVTFPNQAERDSDGNFVKTKSFKSQDLQHVLQVSIAWLERRRIPINKETYEYTLE